MKLIHFLMFIDLGFTVMDTSLMLKPSSIDTSVVASPMAKLPSQAVQSEVYKSSRPVRDGISQ